MKSQQSKPQKSKHTKETLRKLKKLRGSTVRNNKKLAEVVIHTHKLTDVIERVFSDENYKNTVCPEGMIDIAQEYVMEMYELNSFLNAHIKNLKRMARTSRWYKTEGVHVVSPERFLYEIAVNSFANDQMLEMQDGAEMDSSDGPVLVINGNSP
jgi:hypothetical protein